jgi:hypothetical protein
MKAYGLSPKDNWDDWDSAVPPNHGKKKNVKNRKLERSKARDDIENQIYNADEDE